MSRGSRNRVETEKWRYVTVAIKTPVESFFKVGFFVDLDLGAPARREAGFRHPAIVVTAQRILDAEPSVVQIVPLTSTLRAFSSEVEINADDANGLEQTSAAQCQHVRAVAAGRIERTRGNVGPTVLVQVRELLGLIFDVPG